MNNVNSISIEGKAIVNSMVDEPSFYKQAKNSKIINGLELNWWHFKIRITLARIIINAYSRPKDWLLAFKYLVQLRKKFLGNYKLRKMVMVDSKYYMGLYTPGWNDLNYKRFITSELNHFKPVKKEILRFNHVHLAITKKCALQCDHCYAWDILNQRDTLNEKDL